MTEAEIRAALARAERRASQAGPFPQTRKTGRMLQEAIVSSGRNRGRVRELWRDASALVRLVKAYKDGSYRKWPKKTIAMSAVAALYFIDPFSLIRRGPILKLVDEAAMIGLVLAAIRDDLEKFQEWEGTIEMAEPSPALQPADRHAR